MPWMSGLVNGLQNRLQQFESARHLKVQFRNPHKGFRNCFIPYTDKFLWRYAIVQVTPAPPLTQEGGIRKQKKKTKQNFHLLGLCVIPAGFKPTTF